MYEWRPDAHNGEDIEKAEKALSQTGRGRGQNNDQFASISIISLYVLSTKDGLQAVEADKLTLSLPVTVKVILQVQVSFHSQCNALHSRLFNTESRS
jgi:hypothetical protein